MGKRRRLVEIRDSVNQTHYVNRDHVVRVSLMSESPISEVGRIEEAWYAQIFLTNDEMVTCCAATVSEVLDAVGGLIDGGARG